MKVRTLLICVLTLTGFSLMAQNVGIDVANPKARLDVKGDIRIGRHTSDPTKMAGRIRYTPSTRIFEGNDSTTAATWKPLQSLWTRCTNWNINRPLGNVGINWSSPTGQLGIKTTSSTDINIEILREIPGPVLKATDLNDATNPFIIDLDRDLSGNPYARFAMSTAYPDEMTIQRNGKIGFGTSATGNIAGLETATVEFADNDANHSDWALRLASDNEDGWPSILFGKSQGTHTSPTLLSNGHKVGEFKFMGYDGEKFVSSATISANIDGATGNNDMPGCLIFETKLDNSSTAGPVERMRITNQGYVGIGTSTPAGILDIRGGTASSGNGTHINIYAQNGYTTGNTNGGNIYFMPGTDHGSGTEGRVGIGTTTPYSMVDVEGSYGASIRTVSSATTLSSSDYTILVSGSSAVTITLPAAGTATGRIYVVKRIGTGNVTVSSASNIDASTTYSMLTQYMAITVQSDGTRWIIIATI